MALISDTAKGGGGEERVDRRDAFGAQQAREGGAAQSVAAGEHQRAFGGEFAQPGPRLIQVLGPAGASSDVADASNTLTLIEP